MKRSRSPSTEGGIFSSNRSSRLSQSPPEKKLQISLKEVVEREPYIASGDLYMIRKIRLGDRPGSLTMELDRSMEKEETGVLATVLNHLNDLRERTPLDQRKPRLSIKLQSNPQDDYSVKAISAKKEDMVSFIHFLAEESHISKKTAEDTLILFEESYMQNVSASLTS
ncbi:MAG: hypothetical protein JSR33_09480 [Proteobacteria bacterium]|nr:hypothetical protein [Pseudomonadota bacterium]